MGNLPRYPHTIDPQLSPAFQPYVDELVDAIRALAAALIGRASAEHLAATGLDGDS